MLKVVAPVTKGRARIWDKGSELVISIPPGAKLQYVIAKILAMAWIGGNIYYAGRMLLERPIHGNRLDPSEWLMYLFFTGMFGLVFTMMALTSWLWRDIIRIGPDAIRVARRWGLIPLSSNTYPIADIRWIRARTVRETYMTDKGSREEDVAQILLRYQGKNIRLARYLDEAEIEHIVTAIRDRTGIPSRSPVKAQAASNDQESSVADPQASEEQDPDAPMHREYTDVGGMMRWGSVIIDEGQPLVINMPPYRDIAMVAAIMMATMIRLGPARSCNVSNGALIYGISCILKFGVPVAICGTVLWFLRGQETVNVGGEYLDLTWSLFNYKWTRRYEISSITRLRLNKSRKSGEVLYIGGLEFFYGLKTIGFAKGLKLEDAERVLAKIEERMGSRSYSEPLFH